MGRTQIGLHSYVFNLFQSRPTLACVFFSPLHEISVFSFAVTGKIAIKCQRFSLLSFYNFIVATNYSYIYIKLYKLRYQICFAAPDTFYLGEEGAKWLF